MQALDIVASVLSVLAAVGDAVRRALAEGDASTLEALRAVLKTPDEMRDLDRLLIEAQRAKAARELGGG